MSMSGTHPQWAVGWDAGYKQGTDECKRRHRPLIRAANALLKKWDTNKNLSAEVQVLAKLVEDLK